jgi:hypothetical protein
MRRQVGCATISIVLAICVSFNDSTGDCNLIFLFVDWVIMESNLQIARRAKLMIYGEATEIKVQVLAIQ